MQLYASGGVPLTGGTSIYICLTIWCCSCLCTCLSPRICDAWAQVSQRQCEQRIGCPSRILFFAMLEWSLAQVVGRDSIVVWEVLTNLQRRRKQVRHCCVSRLFVPLLSAS